MDPVSYLMSDGLVSHLLFLRHLSFYHGLEVGKVLKVDQQYFHQQQGGREEEAGRGI